MNRSANERHHTRPGGADHDLLLKGHASVAGDGRIEPPVNRDKACSVGTLTETRALSGLDIELGQPPTQSMRNAGIEHDSDHAACPVTRLRPAAPPHGSQD